MVPCHCSLTSLSPGSIPSSKAWGRDCGSCLCDDGLKVFVLSVSVHLCPCGHACAHVCRVTRKPEVNVRCLLQPYSSVFFETGVFHKTWSSPIWLN